MWLTNVSLLALMGCIIAACSGNTDRGKDTDSEDTNTQDTDTDTSAPVGDLVWALGFGGFDPYTIGEMGRAVVALDDGPMVLGGSFSGTMTLGRGEPNETTLVSHTGNSDLFLARFAPDSTLIWAKSVSGTLNSEALAKTSEFIDPSDLVSDVVLLTDGALGVVGHFHGTAVFGKGEPKQTSLTTPAQNGEGFVARYLADGSFVWARRLEEVICKPAQNPDGYPCFGAALADGTFAVAGNFQGSATISAGEDDEVEVTGPIDSANMFIAGFQPDGSLRFGKSTGENQGHLEVHALAHGKDGGFHLMANFQNRRKATDLDNTLVLGSDGGPKITLDCSFREPDNHSGDGICDYEFLATYNASSDISDVFVVLDRNLEQGAGLAVLDDSFVISGIAWRNDIVAPQSKKPVRVPDDDEQDYIQSYMVTAWFSKKGELTGKVSLAKGRGQLSGLGVLPDGSVVAAGWFYHDLTFNDDRQTYIVAPKPPTGGNTNSLTARFTADGELMWAEALGSTYAKHQSIDLAVLSPSRFVTTGFFYGDAIFNQGKPTEKTLIASGGFDGFLAVYEK